MTTPTKATSDGRPKARGLDPELQRMARIDRLLAELSDRGRRRVLQWIADRHATEAAEPARYRPSEEAARAEKE